MTRALVTGGAGFIGSHLCATLLNQDYEVRVIDNLISGKREWLPANIDFMEADISDFSACLEAMQDIEVVFHCAAMSRASLSIDFIEACTKTNILGTQNILLAARDANVKKFIYSGSSTYYGNHPLPHHEQLPPSEFLNFYALSKYVGEQYTLMFDEIFNLPCIILRYFNVYGPRQPMLGPYALVMGIFLECFRKNEDLIIHGDGLQTRDFIHVQDVVAANIKASQSAYRKTIFNVGYGKSHSIKELANLISNKQIHAERRLGDADHTLADTAAIKEKLNWSPKISLEQGVLELKRL